MQNAYAVLLKTTADAFAESGVDTPRLDAEILLAHTLGCERAALMVRAEAPKSVELEKFTAMVARRIEGEPVAYITGYQPFWNHDFLVNPHTLIPRQDTEALIEVALKDLPQDGQILDLGTGSGCIMLSILEERPSLTGLGLDISSEALELARRNAQNMGLKDRASFAESDWFSALPEPGKQFCGIVSNPPYIPTPDIEVLMADVRDFEPVLALDGGPDGLVPYRLIVEAAPQYLVSGGLLAVEVGVLQSNDVAAMFTAAGLNEVQITRDLPGMERVVSGKK